MALNSLEMASDGMLRTGGINSLTAAAQGLLRVTGVSAILKAVRTFSWRRSATVT